MVELWIGESKPPILKIHNMVLDSALNYLPLGNPKTPYSFKRLFLDSGGFAIARRGIELDKERVKEVQEKLNPDKAVPLDYPFQPGQSINIMAKLWEKTKNNILEWQETTRLREIVPVVHAWNYESLRENILWIYRHVNANYIALGVVTLPTFTSYNGYFTDRQPSLMLVKLLSLAIKMVKSYTNFKIHLMGFGSSPLTLHLAYYMGVDSTDTTGYRRKAAYGKIVLPGSGERYVGRGDARFGVTKFSPRDWRLLMECDCPVCKVDRSLLWNNWIARAIHNKYVLEMEAVKARQLMEYGLEYYEEYLDSIFLRSSPNFRAYWEFLRRTAKQTILDMFL